MIPADVEKFIARKFRSADQENAVALLEAAALHDGTAPSPRLLRCAAVASDGSIERLRMDQKIEPLNPQDIADLERLATSVEECPAPPNRNCLCRSHPLLLQTDSKGLGLIAQVLKSFPMKDVP
ncbi:MAG: hypothetical protein HY322_09060 [Betaproteobacteria bacterium]|nr:hypothetical protein [Betaproteobacteria bacterium]